MKARAEIMAEAGYTGGGVNRMSVDTSQGGV